MVVRIMLAIGCLALPNSVAGAQVPGAAPQFRLTDAVTDSSLMSLLPARSVAARLGLPAPARLHFDPFARDERATNPPFPVPSSGTAAPLPSCRIPVLRADAIEDPMPIAMPDSAWEYTIRVAPPSCIASSTS